MSIPNAGYQKISPDQTTNPFLPYQDNLDHKETLRGHALPGSQQKASGFPDTLKGVGPIETIAKKQRDQDTEKTRLISEFINWSIISGKVDEANKVLYSYGEDLERAIVNGKGTEYMVEMQALVMLGEPDIEGKMKLVQKLADRLMPKINSPEQREKLAYKFLFEFGGQYEISPRRYTKLFADLLPEEYHAEADKLLRDASEVQNLQVAA